MNREIPELKIFSSSLEDIWVNRNTVFKFYKGDGFCDICGYSYGGCQTLVSDGPWDMECRKCGHKWHVVETNEQTEKKVKVLNMIKAADDLVARAYKLWTWGKDE